MNFFQIYIQCLGAKECIFTSSFCLSFFLLLSCTFLFSLIGFFFSMIRTQLHKFYQSLALQIVSINIQFPVIRSNCFVTLCTVFTGTRNKSFVISIQIFLIVVTKVKWDQILSHVHKICVLMSRHLYVCKFS